MNRRRFLSFAAIAGAAALPKALPKTFFPDNVKLSETKPQIAFRTSDRTYDAVYARALSVLNKNVTEVWKYQEPVLIEGSVYGGIWLECAPQEGLAYSQIRPDVARNNHLAFFKFQREDGQIPCWIRKEKIGFAQIQMVVPIAATAWELSRQTGDSELLEKASSGCSRWDAWLRQYRDTRHTGLCEGFCTFDTGHDNSPRWAGIPDRCPDGDARKCPPISSLPRLCPDLSSTVYGGRVALATMAGALGRNSERDHWLELAAAIRSAILEKLYSPGDAAFYDLDAQNKFVRIRSDVISRVLGEHVVDQKLFEAIWQKEIHNPAAFWAPYPLPSIALDDPAFVRPIPRNSWGGASQALTALRATRWMEHYKKPAEFAHLMQQWIAAILRNLKFFSQLDPLDGTFTTDLGDYSPAALVFMDFTWRLSGVRLVGDSLEWNVRLLDKAQASFVLQTKVGPAELSYWEKGAELRLNGRTIGRTRNTVRLITALDGTFKSAVGIDAANSNVVITDGPHGEQRFVVRPNETVDLA